jgi:hypothetical protein
VPGTVTILTLAGVDPGIQDTALTSFSLDFDRKRIEVKATVWHDVTTRTDDGRVLVDVKFLSDLQREVHHLKRRTGATFVGIEGFRQRGTNQHQDQRMLFLVQKLTETLPGSTIVDNTGIRRVVKEQLLALFQARRFPGTYHADSKSAARVALRLGIENKAINMLLSDFVRDQLDGVTWQFGSM